MRKRWNMWWKREKRKVAVLLAVCCLAGGIADRQMPGIQAAGSETGLSEPDIATESESLQPESGKGEENPPLETEDGTDSGITGMETEYETEETDTESVNPGAQPAEETGETVTETESSLLRIERTAAFDRTDDITELQIKLEQMNILDKSNKNLSYKLKSDAANEIYDVSEYSYYDIGRLKFKISFQILKKYDAGREIKAGDYFTYKIPQGFRIGGSFLAGTVMFGSVPIASYVKETDSAGSELLKFTFEEAVNAGEAYNDIAGGMNLELEFDSAALEGENKIVPLLPQRGGSGTGVLIKLPEEPSLVNGITKKGVHNSERNTITWTIELGTKAESKGISMNGLVVSDMIGEGQTYVPDSAKLIHTNGSAAEGNVAVTEAGRTISCTLEGATVKAPCILQLETAITKEKLEEAKSAAMQPALMEFSNEAEMKPPVDGSLLIGTENHAEAVIEAQFGTTLAKTGRQVDSNTIHWTIEVNHMDPRVHVYHGAVTDNLMKGLTYKTGTMRYRIEDGTAQTPAAFGGTLTPWPDHALEVTGDGATGQTLKFYLQSDTKNKYKIEFDTTVEEGFTGTTGSNGDAVVTNDAVITAELPCWTGTGPSYIDWDYGIPGIECAFDSSMMEKEVTADPKTGILTWTIYPSTRTADYDEAIITDLIEDRQELILNSLEVQKKDGNPIGAGIIKDYSASDKKLTVIIPKTAGNVLGDYKIVYKTYALDYFSENQISRTYTNTAVLNIKKAGSFLAEKQAKASIVMKNPFLSKKTSFEYIGNVGYFHYTIDVNGNGMELHHVVITDDISNCIFSAKNADGSGSFVAIPSRYWEFDRTQWKIMKNGVQDTSKSCTFLGDEVTADLGEISDRYTIHLYAKLKDSGKALLTEQSGADSLANKRVYSTNTVQAKSDEVKPVSGGAFLAVSDSQKQNVWMDNTLVRKSAPDFSKENSTITWNIAVNPNGGPLVNAILHDQLPKTAKHLSDSVVLYNAEYQNGKLVKGTKSSSQPAITYDVDKDYRYMNAALDENTSGAYILEYKTAIVDAGRQSVSNQVSMKSGAGEYGSDTAKMELSGGNWGTLSTAGKLEIVNYDASVGSAMPLQGAEFTVYSDVACTDPVDVGETDVQGKLTFYGLEAGTGDIGTTYYLKETKTPSSGYVENTAVYPVLVKRGKTHQITVENERKEAETAAKAEVIKQYSYRDIAGTVQTVTSYQSQFELWFYPYGSGSAKDSRTVSFVENGEGEYSYSASGGPGTVSVLKNSTADGKIVFTGLPWGYYGLKEIKVPDGFAAYSDMKYFEIHYIEGQGSSPASFQVEYKFSSDGTDNRITNESTSVFVKKLRKGSTEYLPGVKLQVCTKKSDGTLVVVKNPITGEAYEWTTNALEAAAGYPVRSIPAGSYVLHEENTGTDPVLTLAEDIPFTVDKYGVLKQNNTVVSVLTMYDAKNTLTVRKEDQFGEAVNDASLTVTGPNAVSADGYRKTVTTADGKAVFEDLVRGGIYTLSETSVPEGYKVAADVRIRVSEDGTEIFERTADGMEHKIEGSYTMLDRKLLVTPKIRKIDAFFGKQLEGAEFSLYRKADHLGDADKMLLGTIKMTAHGSGTDAWTGWDITETDPGITNAYTGKALNKGLNQGSYYLKETKVPDGYKAAPDTEFEITGNGELLLHEAGHARMTEGLPETIEILDEPLTLRIEKYDADAHIAPKGAEYEVTGMFASESVEKTYTLRADAAEQKNTLSGRLLPGNVYKVKETKAPLGYLRTDAAYFKIDAAGNVAVTDAAGIAAVRADVLAANPADEVNGTDGALQIINKQICVDFVKCTSEDNSPINGAEFTIQGTFADGTDQKTLRPSAENPAELKGQLIEGNTYTLTEIAPAGYLPLTEKISFTCTMEDALKLTAGGGRYATVFHASSADSGYQEETLVITNDSAQNTSLQFIKYDAEDNSGISNVVFEVAFTPEGSTRTQIINYTIPEAGTVINYVTAGKEHQKVTVFGEGFLADLERGTYTLTEKTAAYAYELGEEPFSCSFTVDDRAKNKTVVLNSTNARNHAYDLNVTGGEKLLTSKGIQNERMTGSVTLIKVDALDQTKHLNGVGFTIYRYKDSKNVIDWLKQLFTGNAYKVAEGVWNGHADKNGRLTITGLPWGNYYIVETAPLDQYVPDDTRYEFTIGKDRLNQVLDWTPGRVITNAKVQLAVQQLTAAGAQTIGNRMRIYGRFANYNGPYMEWTVGSEPHLIAGELLEGEKYTLEEVSPYEGYASAATLTFLYSSSGIQILEGGDFAEFSTGLDGTMNLIQKVPPIRAAIKKADEKNRFLSGARLQLEHVLADGTTEVLKEWTSAEDMLELEGVLCAGEEYLLKEIKAPEGYELAEDIPFAVKDTPEWQYVTMTDQKETSKDTETEDTEDTKDTEDTEKGGGGDTGNSGQTPGNTGNPGMQEGGSPVQKPDADGSGALLPKTGREVRTIYYLAGGLLILAGIALCLNGKKKRRREKNNNY